MNILKPARLWFILVIALASVFLAGCVASPLSTSGNLIIGQSYRLQEGETLHDDLAIIGGNGIVESGAEVDGDVSVIGGTLEVSGEISGDITSIGAVIQLTDTAVVSGNVNTIGGTLKRAAGAEIAGGIGSSNPQANSFDGSNFRLNFEPIGEIFSSLFEALAITALAVVASLFLSLPMVRVTDTLSEQPFASGAFGLLTLIVAPALLLILAVTIILSPLALLGALGLGIAVLFGWVSIGMMVGERLGQLFKVEWSEPISAGVGTLLMTLLANLFNAIPCVGWALPFVVATIGLGGVLLSGFGTNRNLFNVKTNSPHTPPPPAPGVIDSSFTPAPDEPAPAPTDQTSNQ